MDLDKAIRCGTVGIVFRRIINLSIPTLHGLVGRHADQAYRYYNTYYRCIRVGAASLSGCLGFFLQQVYNVKLAPLQAITVSTTTTTHAHHRDIILKYIRHNVLSLLIVDVVSQTMMVSSPRNDRTIREVYSHTVRFTLLKLPLHTLWSLNRAP